MRTLALSLSIFGLVSSALSFPLSDQNSIFDKSFDQISQKLFDHVLIPAELGQSSGLRLGNSPAPIDDGRNLHANMASALRSSTVTGIVVGGIVSLNVVNTTATVLSVNSTEVVSSSNATLLTVATNSSVNAVNSNGVLIAIAQNSSVQAAVSNSRATVITDKSNGTIVLSNASLFLGATKSRVVIAAVNSTIGIMNETSTIKVVGRNNTVTYITNLDGLAWSSGEMKRHNPESMIQTNNDPAPTTPEPNQDGIAWDSGSVKRKDAQSNENNQSTTPEPNQDGLAWGYEDSANPKRDQFQWSKLFLWSDQFLWFDRLGSAFDQHRELMRKTVEKVHSLHNDGEERI